MNKARILIVEDESIIAHNLRRTLEQLGYIASSQVSSGEAAIAKAAEWQPDLVLMDIVLQGAMDGIQAAEQIREHLGIPVIFLTAYADDATLKQASVIGPFGYILKPFEERDLHITIQMALYKHQMERRLQESQEKLLQLSRVVEQSPSTTVITNLQGDIEYVNPRFTRLTGYTAAEVIGQNPRLLKSGKQPSEFYREMWETIASGQEWRSEFCNRKKNGELYWELASISPIRNAAGTITHFVKVAEDITERKQAEELADAQRSLALALGAVHRLDEALRLCLETAIRISGMDCGGIYLVDETARALDLVLHQGLPPDFVSSASHYESDSPSAQLVLAGQPVYTEHLQLGVPVNGVRRGEGLRAIAILPVRHEDQVIACLNIASHSLDAVPAFARTALEAIAIQVGSAVARQMAEHALREAEHRYRALFEQAHDAVFILDLEGRHLEANQRAADLLGYTRAEIQNISFQEVSAEVSQSAQVIARLVAGEHVPLYERRFRKKDGTIVPVELNVELVRDLEGRPLHIQSVVRDISARKRAEEALQRYTNRLEALRQVGLEITAQLNLDDLLHSVAAHAIELLEGTGGGAYLYRPDLDALEWAVGVNEPAPLGITLRRGEGLAGKVWESGEAMLVDDYGRWAGRAPAYDESDFGSVVETPIRWGDEFLGVLAVNGGPTRAFSEADADLLSLFAAQAAIAIENAHLFAEVQTALQQLKEAQVQLVQSARLAAIGELAAGMAHEINNPLTSILGFAELASWKLAPDDPGRQDLEIIVSEAKRTRDIVRNLLDFARQTKPLTELADVNHVLRQTLALIRAHVQKNGGIVEEQYASDVDRIPLDVGQMKQVFLNLITNAAHAMPDGGRLTVSTARVEDQVAVRIADTGVGIAPQDQERLFEPFFTTKPSGTGLGLSVSLGIVQQHGGRIEVESQMGKGSTFTVWLPVGGGT